MSTSLIITLRELRPKFEASGGFESRSRFHRIPDLYSKRLLRIFFLAVLESVVFRISDNGCFAQSNNCVCVTYGYHSKV
jgi:hypothetical protein